MPIPIILPKFGFTLESSTIVAWLKGEGESVRAGDPIAEVTTDKVNMEIEAPEAGTLYGLKYGVGEEVKVTEVICYLARKGEAILPPEAAGAASPQPTLALATPPPTDEPATITPLARRIAHAEQVDLAAVNGSGPNGRITRRDVEGVITGAGNRPTAAQGNEDGKVRATPAARHLAAENAVDLTVIAGSGPRGRIQAPDVHAALQQAAKQQVAYQAKLPPASAAASQPATSVTSVGSQVKLTGMRKTIASRLQKSYQTAPHFFVEMQVDTAAIDALRAKLKARNHKLSVTAVIVRACADALKKHPNVNATLQDDDLTLWNACNIGVAVALDQGLIVPVIHQAETLSLGATQQQLDNLTARARSNTLHVNDLVDGTFTISNLGMMGVDRFTAIINPPQVAILAVGKASRVFVPDEAGNPVVKSLMTLVLSSDHRVVDGAVAAAFLGDLKSVLEDPTLLLW